jgi:hypothetical protein
MECYFYSQLRGKTEEGQHIAILSFAVPDAGIVFRTKFTGVPEECEYAALLTLLEFVELNPQVFQDKCIEIYGDSFTVVNQMNEKMFCSRHLQPFRNMALLFKNKFSYSLNWVPTTSNPAQFRLQTE